MNFKYFVVCAVSVCYFGVYKSLFLFFTASSHRIFGLKMCACSLPEGQLTQRVNCPSERESKYASNSSELLHL